MILAPRADILLVQIFYEGHPNMLQQSAIDNSMLKPAILLLHAEDQLAQASEAFSIIVEDFIM